MSRDFAATSALLRGAVFVTGNESKLIEARRICGIDLAADSIDLPEIQSLDLTKVLRAKADEAWRRLERPLVVEETGLELEAFGGFPGPLVKWFLEAAGPEGIAAAAIALDNPGATARCALLYRDAERQVIGSGSTTGELVLPPRGSDGFGWDPVFQPRGEQLTYAELGAVRKDEIGHRGHAWRALLDKLEETSV